MSEIAENECETDRRLCAEAADGLGSSRARRRNTAFVLPAVCLPACIFCLSARLSASRFVWKCFKAHKYAPVLISSSFSFSNLPSLTSLLLLSSLILLSPVLVSFASLYRFISISPFLQSLMLWPPNHLFSIHASICFSISTSICPPSSTACRDLVDQISICVSVSPSSPHLAARGPDVKAHAIRPTHHYS